MKVLLIALLAVSSVYAQTISTVENSVSKKFRISDRTDFGGRVYYSCDSVESHAKKLLKTLGATNIDVDCRGGFEPHTRMATPAFLTASFTAKASDENGSGEGYFEEFKIRSFNNCHLFKDLFKNFKDGFEFERIDRISSCMRSSDHVRISGSVLK